MNKIFSTFFFMLFISFKIGAQVKTNFNNTEKLSNRGQFNKSYSASLFEITPPDLVNAFRRDKTEDSLSSKLFYIAEPVATNINFVKLANWVEDEKFAYGKFTLFAKGAKTLSINFSNFFLPKGTEMFIYNKEAEMITGVVTEKENNKNRIWGSSIYKGDEITIEIKLPIPEKQNLSLLVTNVAYGYKDIFISKIAGFGQSGACNINVLCPLGNGWEPERNSVVYIARSNGSALCSGAMVMNTCATDIPYVLTANHCFNPPGQPQQDLSQWRVHFQAWSATCTPSQNSDGILFNGSTLRANWAPSDFCLIQLNQTPAANSGINYAGWTRQTNAATSGVGIHHPSGDVMKISNYTTPLVREDNPTRCNINPVGELHWVVQWNQGVTEGGSSGSPLFDQNHRIVGQLSGGPSDCSQPANCRMDMYGRFDNSWTGGGTNATRLSNWLDPSGTGAITTNTTNVANLTSVVPNSYSITGLEPVCTSSTYSVAGLQSGVGVTWSASPAGQANLTPSGNQVIVTRIGNANAIITLTANLSGACAGPSPIATRQIVIGKGTNAIVYNNCTISCNPNGAYLYANIVPIGNGTICNWYAKNNAIANSQFVFLENAPWGTDYPLGSKTRKYTIRAEVINACGTLIGDQVISLPSCTGGGTNRMIIASPNPATNNISIQITDEQGKVSIDPNDKIYELQVVDKLGNIYKQIKFNEGVNQPSINISNLKPDIYFIKAFNGTDWLIVQIIKQ